MPDGQEYKSGLYKNLLSAYGKDNLPDEQTFYKKLDTDSTYRDGVYKNLENAYGKDNLPDYATFETKIGVKKKEPTATTSSMPVVTSGEDLNKLALGGGQNQTSTLKLPSQLNLGNKKKITTPIKRLNVYQATDFLDNDIANTQAFTIRGMEEMQRQQQPIGLGNMPKQGLMNPQFQQKADAEKRQILIEPEQLKKYSQARQKEIDRKSVV